MAKDVYIPSTMTPGPPRKPRRKLRSDTKYKPEYAKELLSGVRFKKHWSIAHLCKKWRISRTTYQGWVEKHEEFRDAHLVAKEDYEAYLMDRVHANMDGTERGSAAVLNFAMTNLADWSTKSQVTTHKEEPIMAININIVPPPVRALEQKEGNIIEHQVCLPDNVVSIHGE